MFNSLCATLSAIVATYRKNERTIWFKRIKASGPVSAKQNMSISNNMAKMVTGQSPMTNLKHLSADYDHRDGLYAAAVGTKTHFRH